jgi:hypothetical protein
MPNPELVEGSKHQSYFVYLFILPIAEVSMNILLAAVLGVVLWCATLSDVVLADTVATLAMSRAFAAHTTPTHPSVRAPHAVNTVNAVLGDESFVKTFGIAPTPTTNETLRLQTHLAYVERLLRERDCSSLPPALRQRRRELLDKLHEYWLAGRFPVNEAYPNERRPCFIDRFGSICAVGYLIEQSMEHGAGRELAERINAHHQYEYIAAMTMPALAAWVAASGLTTEECAMIQPAYCFRTPSSTTATGTAFRLTIDACPPLTDVIRATRATLGLHELTILNRTASSVTFLVPAVANIPGTFLISFWTSSQPSQRLLSFVYTINPLPPPPAITLVTPSSSTKSVNEKFTMNISGAGFTDASKVRLEYWGRGVNNSPVVLSLSTNIINRSTTNMVALVPVIQPVLQTNYDLDPTKQQYGCFTLVVENPDGQMAVQPYCFLTNVVGVNDKDIDEDLQALPNPAADLLTLRTELAAPELVTVRLRNLLGQDAQPPTTEYAQRGVYERLVQVSGLPRGAYLLELHTGSKHIVKHIVKQ